jgi:hypothetical protein
MADSPVAYFLPEYSHSGLHPFIGAIAGIDRRRQCHTSSTANCQGAPIGLAANFHCAPLLPLSYRFGISGKSKVGDKIMERMYFKKELIMPKRMAIWSNLIFFDPIHF